jgi:simple sugar transport system permease protein
MYDLLIAASPLLFAALGALFTELAGALGIFIEGFMGIGAFFAYVFLVKTGSVAAACCLTALLGAGLGWALARFITVSGADPFIVGLALNLAAGGATTSLSEVWFGTKGVLRHTGIQTAGALPIFVLIAVICYALAGVFVYRTRPGLRLRAGGLSPKAALERGVSVRRYQEGAWMIAGLLAAVSGVCLTLRVGAYTPGGVSGRGWIALAAVYLGFRTVGGTALAALVFALAEYAGIRLQSIRSLPATALLGIPSALALNFYTVSCLIRKKGRLDGTTLH